MSTNELHLEDTIIIGGENRLARYAVGDTAISGADHIDREGISLGVNDLHAQRHVVGMAFAELIPIMDLPESELVADGQQVECGIKVDRVQQILGISQTVADG